MVADGAGEEAEVGLGPGDVNRCRERYGLSLVSRLQQGEFTGAGADAIGDGFTELGSVFHCEGSPGFAV